LNKPERVRALGFIGEMREYAMTAPSGKGRATLSGWTEDSMEAKAGKGHDITL
jgi:hypothetical protein